MVSEARSFSLWEGERKECKTPRLPAWDCGDVRTPLDLWEGGDGGRVRQMAPWGLLSALGGPWLVRRKLVDGVPAGVLPGSSCLFPPLAHGAPGLTQGEAFWVEQPPGVDGPGDRLRSLRSLSLPGRMEAALHHPLPLKQKMLACKKLIS